MTLEPNSCPPASPIEATLPQGRTVASSHARVGPPTLSIAPAQRAGSSGRGAPIPVTAARSTTAPCAPERL